MKIRTGYSFRTAVGKIDEVLSRIEAIGWKVAPISDRNSTFGFTKWMKAAKKKGLRPIYGVELGVVVSLGEKKPIVDYWSFFAKDDLLPLHQLISEATLNMDREPSITYDVALKAKGLIKIAGERFQFEYLNHKTQKITKVEPPAKDFFIGLSPSTPLGLFRKAKVLGFRFLATSDNFYPVESDKEFYRVTLGRRSSTQTYPTHILDDGEWARACEYAAGGPDLAEAVKNRSMAFLACKAELKKASLLIPKKPKTLKAMCEAGAKRTGIDLGDPIYKARLKKELDLIASKKFEDYFYVIADMIDWAKERMIVGPARGSSCGSLVCYLIGITSIDPIPFDLIFERFIDINRTDLPDIDIDFSDKQRQLVFDYAERKYGPDHVARLGTVGVFRPRSALKQAASVLRIPGWKTEQVLDGLIERSGGDSRALQALEDTLTTTDAGRKMLVESPEVMIAARMEGHPSVSSQHAAGIVITQEPVMNYVAIDQRTKSTMCDKYDAEELNLLKIDALGLTQLSIFERTLELIGEEPVSGWLEKLPLDDAAAFEVLNKGQFAGIFQFAGIALQSLTKQITVTDIEDIISITALARPGPLASGGANDWVKRKNGEPVTLPHKLFEPQLKTTLGIVMYQEQVMQIGRDIGDLSWEDVTALRKAMSKSLGKEFFDQYGDRFKTAARKKGIPSNVLDKVWDDLCAYGSWAFNRSHSVAYGMVSYWCCWLKAHHPVEFAAASLDAEHEPQKQIAMLRELRDEGIGYKSVDVEHSTDRWTPTKKGGKQILVGPLTAIKGIGPATMLEIMDARKAGKEIRPALMKRIERAQTDLDTLYPIRDAIAKIHPDLSKVNILSTPKNLIDVQPELKHYNDFLILALAIRIVPRDENEEVNMAKRVAQGRSRVVKGPTAYLNLFVRDDTDEIYCKIDRFQFEKMGRAIVERGRAGKSLYAIKGTCPPRFRMIMIKQIKFLGDIERGVDLDLFNAKPKEETEG